MKKIYYRITALFFAFIILFIGFPFNSLNRVKAETNVATNFIDFLRTNLGLAKVNNGSLSNVSRDDFAQSLYNTPLVWTDNGVNFSFTPSDEFTKSQWNHMCIYGGSDDTRFVDFDLQDCLIKSQYIEDNGSGLNLSKFPKLSDNTNTVSPLDGIEVKTNFSDFSYGQSDVTLYGITADYIKSNVANNSSSYIVYSGKTSKNGNVYLYKTAYIGLNDVDFYALVRNNINNNNSQYYVASFYNGTWSQVIGRYSALLLRTNYSTNNLNVLYYSNNPSYIYTANNLSFSDNLITYGSSRYGSDLYYPNIYFDDIKFYSNKPIVFASSYQFAQNYYYWLRGNPDGSFYSTANSNTIYSYDYITNNNWETAYNNYITDVSNYYSTTENITNEQLSQYIDNSTNITYITNNYIDNSGSGGESGGGSVDSGILASWLEKIFDRVTDIYYALIGKDDSGDIYYNDNSIRYSIIEYPLSDLFPSVPQSRFIPYSDIFDFGIAQDHLNGVMRQIIPFCYLYQLQTIATALASPPQAPHYEIPFVIERLNIDEQITIDLTSSAWTTIHSIWITLFMIMLIFALLYATYKFLILLNSIFG